MIEAETRIIQASLRAILSTSELIDKFSTWLLAGVGVTAALCVTNILQITTVLSADQFRFSMYILMIAGVFGVLSKYLATVVQIKHRIDLYIRNELKDISHCDGNGIGESTSKNFRVFVDEIGNTAPPFARDRFKKNMKDGFADPLLGNKKAISDYYKQVMFGFFQFLCFIWFIGYIAYSV